VSRIDRVEAINRERYRNSIGAWIRYTNLVFRTRQGLDIAFAASKVLGERPAIDQNFNIEALRLRIPPCHPLTLGGLRIRDWWDLLHQSGNGNAQNRYEQFVTSFHTSTSKERATTEVRTFNQTILAQISVRQAVSLSFVGTRVAAKSA
jgi:hypothetical protein